MTSALNETHDPAVKSWVESANRAGSDFPVQNLPLWRLSPERQQHPAARRRGHRRFRAGPRRCASRGAARSVAGTHRASLRILVAEQADDARSGTLVAVAARIAFFPSRRWRKRRKPGSGPQAFAAAGGRRAFRAGGDRRLHRFLRLHPSRDERGQPVPARQSAAAELQVAAGRLSRARLVDCRQRDAGEAPLWPIARQADGAGAVRSHAAARLRTGSGILRRAGECPRCADPDERGRIPHFRRCAW